MFRRAGNSANYIFRIYLCCKIRVTAPLAALQSVNQERCEVAVPSNHINELCGCPSVCPVV